jgi:ankyrin repeat protein
VKEIEELVYFKNGASFKAVKVDDTLKMEKIFKTGGIQQEAIDHLMFDVKSVEMLKLFLQYGGDTHKLGPRLHPRPHTLLYCYMKRLKDRKEKKFMKLIEFLIGEGADVGFQDEGRETAFQICAFRGQFELGKRLVERGADPFVSRKSDKCTALHLAAHNGHIEIVRYLVDNCGLYIDSMTSDLQTPLFLAALEGRTGVCKYLLEKGASADAGRQPLLVAALVRPYYLSCLEWSFEYLQSSSDSWSQSSFARCQGI